MILNINTSDPQLIEVYLEKNGVLIKKKKAQAHRQQSEKLLKLIDSLFQQAGIKKEEISKIKVAHQGSSFTALRIGVLTANALAYALGIEVEPIKMDKKALKEMGSFNLVIPDYDRDPEITLTKNKIL